MTGLSKITDKILDEARRDAAQKLAEADAECKRISEEYAEKAKNITESANAAAKSEAAEIALRTRAAEKTVRKNIMLGLQAEMIDRAFEIAQKEISDIEGEARLELLTGLLCAALWSEYEAQKDRAELYGEQENEDAVQVYEVLLQKRDHDKLGQALISNFKRKIVGKDMGDIPERVVLSSDVVDIDGGLVLRCGSVEINNSIEAIFSYLRPKLEAEVAKILFP
jgi:V/A-type H+-transporting ATPase subunit E